MVSILATLKRSTGSIAREAGTKRVAIPQAARRTRQRIGPPLMPAPMANSDGVHAAVRWLP